VEVNIVGAASDEEMLEEIQDITKVFVYEQRMKGYIKPLQPYLPAKTQEPRKKPIVPYPWSLTTHVPGFVKGFC
jgi:hypothetical protein